MRFILLDIDGTLASIGDRLKHIKSGDYATFNKTLTKSTVNRSIKELLSVLSEKEYYQIIIVTGRPVALLTETIDWLDANNIYFNHILMRENNDYRSDNLIKADLLSEFLGSIGKGLEDIAFALEDRHSVVKTYRDLGINTWQVNPSTY